LENKIRNWVFGFYFLWAARRKGGRGKRLAATDARLLESSGGSRERSNLYK